MCNFDYSSLLTEVALLGNLAARTGRELYRSPEDLRITNYRAGWSLSWPPLHGNPCFEPQRRPGEDA